MCEIIVGSKEDLTRRSDGHSHSMICFQKVNVTKKKRMNKVYKLVRQLKKKYNRYEFGIEQWGVWWMLKGEMGYNRLERERKLQ